VQELESVQEVPLGFAGFEQTPLIGSQVPTTWQASEAEQITGMPPVHTPPMHMSPWVQALFSLQLVPSTRMGFEQTPVSESQLPTEWH
jgi:hypothetical protein